MVVLRSFGLRSSRQVSTMSKKTCPQVTDSPDPGFWKGEDAWTQLLCTVHSTSTCSQYHLDSKGSPVENIQICLIASFSFLAIASRPLE